MATPNVFVSSTCYDLRYIRENLRYFIRTLGYNPVLSEDGGVFYDPRVDVQQACLTEIPNMQLFVLIIGGRSGSTFASSEKSITNAEYSEAVRLKIPVFALVEQGTLHDFDVYLSNIDAGNDISSFVFPNADHIHIFNFIQEVRNSAVNNALVPFRDFSDIESYLKAQWAGMVHSYLVGTNEQARVNQTLEVLTEMSKRIEILTEQVLRSVGTPVAKTNAAMYARMLRSEAIRDLAWLKISPSPAIVLKSDTLLDCAQSMGKTISVDHSDLSGSSLGGGEGPQMSGLRWKDDEADYQKTRSALLELLEAAGLSIEDLDKEEAEYGLPMTESNGSP